MWAPFGPEMYTEPTNTTAHKSESISDGVIVVVVIIVLLGIVACAFKRRGRFSGRRAYDRI